MSLDYIYQVYLLTRRMGVRECSTWTFCRSQQKRRSIHKAMSLHYQEAARRKLYFVEPDDPFQLKLGLSGDEFQDSVTSTSSHCVDGDLPSISNDTWSAFRSEASHSCVSTAAPPATPLELPLDKPFCIDSEVFTGLLESHF